MRRKTLEKIDNLEERKVHYKEVAAFLKLHSIPFKKLIIGIEIDIRGIPKHLEEEFINISTYDIWKQKQQ